MKPQITNPPWPKASRGRRASKELRHEAADHLAMPMYRLTHLSELQRSCGMKPQITEQIDGLPDHYYALQRSCGMKPQITTEPPMARDEEAGFKGAAA